MKLLQKYIIEANDIFLDVLFSHNIIKVDLTV